MKNMIALFQNTLLIFLVLTVALNCGQSNAGKNKDSSSLYKADTVFAPLDPTEAAIYSQLVKEYYEKTFKGFNGSILVAKNGQILFEDYRGYYNFETKDTITPHTPFHLASISKTFTGMAILRLWEEGKISLDDTLQKFFPQLPYHGVTIKTLLNHRSGLPNYLYFMDCCWDRKQKATNWDVVNFMIEHKPAAAGLPDKNFNYCNTNFVLLALIIEQITSQPYPLYMKDSVFTPLGMNDTYVFAPADTINYVPTYSVTKPFLMDQYDCTYGDKNIYSTVRDLFLWDKALYQHTFLKKSTLDMAFTPQSNERKSLHNYGLGWRTYFNNRDSLIYHNGRWHGSNTVFIRHIPDTVTIIVLGNKSNSNIYRAKDITTIFTGRIDTTKLKPEL